MSDARDRKSRRVVLGAAAMADQRVSRVKVSNPSSGG